MSWRKIYHWGQSLHNSLDSSAPLYDLFHFHPNTATHPMLRCTRVLQKAKNMHSNIRLWLTVPMNMTVFELQSWPIVFDEFSDYLVICWKHSNWAVVIEFPLNGCSPWFTWRSLGLETTTGCNGTTQRQESCVKTFLSPRRSMTENNLEPMI